MSNKLSSVRGMHDILPEDTPSWHFIEDSVRSVMHGYGYNEMRTPILEKSALFHRGIGEATDIVEKEMYTFPDRKGESLSMRPENTASCVRAALQHGMLAQGVVNRIWYLGPMFRYERPQKGRTRQFHQVGAEVYGVPGPMIEAELIALSARLWKLLGIDQVVRLEVNTLGTSEERQVYRQKLIEYFKGHAAELDEDSQRRLETNPLRILDSKNPTMQSMIEAAPKLMDSLGSESTEHFRQLRETLSGLGIESTVNTRLVRGLDYYSHTVWEWTTELLGAQATVCGGGRYDGLVDELGGGNSPAVGWALGMERLILLIEQVSAERVGSLDADVFVVLAGDVSIPDGLKLAERIRTELPDIRVVQNVTGGSMKNQFKRADRSGASIAVVLGDDEQASGQVTIKPLRSGGEQATVDLDGMASAVSELLAS